MNLKHKLEAVTDQYRELTLQLSQPGITTDKNEFARLSREHNHLGQVVERYQAWMKLEQELGETRQLLQEEDDAELQELAREEAAGLEEESLQLENQLKELLVPPDPDDSRNVIMEIRAGTGGEEAALFAGDLFRMYNRLAELQRWQVETLSTNAQGMGGFKEIVFGVRGKDVFGKLKYEAGVHRVQRVPQTESQGRVHTSASTVAVLPEADEVEINIDPTELRIDVYRATGHGGQSVNTTDSAVRITHLPTNLVVTCQDEKSQHKNKAKAMKVLVSRLYEKKKAEEQEKRSAARRSQVLTGDRSAKIRTYNFPQGRVTDHRINLTLYRLNEVLAGDLEEIIAALRLADKMEKLQHDW
ncbi:MAG: peptide chain release factor 1 [Candidatus Delongbacteria bacterium]|nr:peptide chain release factor 1 [Candidatus Delongbacteria bacterium]